MGRLTCLLLAIVAALSLAAPSLAQDSAAGEYRMKGAFEMYVGLLLREDGTFAFVLSVGAMDKISSGTWQQDGTTVTLTTSPKPVPPVFERAPANDADGEPFVQISWPDGRGIPGIDIVLSCADETPDGTVLRDYSQADGRSPPEGSCARPQWIELTENSHDISSPRFDITDTAGGLRFVLQPNSFGVIDMTGATGEFSGKILTLGFMGSTEEFVRLRAN